MESKQPVQPRGLLANVYAMIESLRHKLITDYEPRIKAIEDFLSEHGMQIPERIQTELKEITVDQEQNPIPQTNEHGEPIEPAEDETVAKDEGEKPPGPPKVNEHGEPIG